MLEAASEWCESAGGVMKLEVIPITKSWYVQLSWGSERILYGCEDLAAVPELLMCPCLTARERRTEASASGFKEWRPERPEGCEKN